MPLVYDLDSSLKPIPAKGAIAPLNGCFLGDADAIAAAAAAVAAHETAVAPTDEVPASVRRQVHALNDKIDEVLPLSVAKASASAASPAPRGFEWGETF